MHILALSLTILFLVGIPCLVAYALFEMSPLAHHDDRYHEPGRRQDTTRLSRSAGVLAFYASPLASPGLGIA